MKTLAVLLLPFALAANAAGVSLHECAKQGDANVIFIPALPDRASVEVVVVPAVQKGIGADTEAVAEAAAAWIDYYENQPDSMKDMLARAAEAAAAYGSNEGHRVTVTPDILNAVSDFLREQAVRIERDESDATSTIHSYRVAADAVADAALLLESPGG